MSEVVRFVAEMKFAFDGDESGEGRFQPAIRPLLRDVDSKRALHRPLPNAHCIWEIVLHMTTWKKYISARFRNEEPQVTDAMDWPAILDTSEAAWQAALQELFSAQDELLEMSSRLSENDLDSPAVNGKIPRYSALHGILQHDMYHGGQIAILKKAAL